MPVQACRAQSAGPDLLAFCALFSPRRNRRCGRRAVMPELYRSPMKVAVIGALQVGAGPEIERLARREARLRARTRAPGRAPRCACHGALPRRLSSARPALPSARTYQAALESLSDLNGEAAIPALPGTARQHRDRQRQPSRLALDLDHLVPCRDLCPGQRPAAGGVTAPNPGHDRLQPASGTGSPDPPAAAMHAADHAQGDLLRQPGATARGRYGRRRTGSVVHQAAHARRRWASVTASSAARARCSRRALEASISLDRPSASRSARAARQRVRSKAADWLLGSSIQAMPRASRVARSRAFATPSSGRTMRRARRLAPRAHLGPRRHGGEAVDAAAAGEPHQQGLGLVVAGVRGQQAADIVRAPCARPSAGSAPPRAAAWMPVCGLGPSHARTACRKPSAAARSATARASSADSGRRPWSTTSTVWRLASRRPAAASRRTAP